MKQKYSVVVFDLGNVLLPFDYNIILRNLDKVEEGLGGKFAEFYGKNYDIHRRFERGELSADQFADIILDVLERKVSKEEFFHIYSNMFSVNEGLVGVLPTLKKNYKLVLLSNTNDIHQRYGWQTNGFLKLFDELVLSHKVGAVKPEEKIYRAVEAFTLVPPEQHLYIDDIPEYVTGGKNMGWDAVQFVGNEELFRAFDARGIVFRESGTR
jgi:glucose-1-phosphatase